jgi:hypothetical protein
MDRECPNRQPGLRLVDISRLRLQAEASQCSTSRVGTFGPNTSSAGVSSSSARRIEQGLSPLRVVHPSACRRHRVALAISPATSRVAEGDWVNSSAHTCPRRVRAVFSSSSVNSASSWYLTTSASVVRSGRPFRYASVTNRFHGAEVLDHLEVTGGVVAQLLGLFDPSPGVCVETLGGCHSSHFPPSVSRRSLLVEHPTLAQRGDTHTAIDRCGYELCGSSSCLTTMSSLACRTEDVSPPGV